MGRWTQYDEDDYRLPDGMKRIGYDADSQKYRFRDQSGAIWEGPEGSEYGDLVKVEPESSTDLEASGPVRGDGYGPLPAGEGEYPHTSNRSAYRTLLPFFLIIMVVLLLVIRLAAPAFLESRRTPLCPQDSRPYEIKKGDSCWAIAKEYRSSVEQLKEVNPKMQCELLIPGQKICLPLASQD